MFNFDLPMTLDEQACMKLYELIRPHIQNTGGDAHAVREAIQSVFAEYVAAFEHEQASSEQLSDTDGDF